MIFVTKLYAAAFIILILVATTLLPSYLWGISSWEVVSSKLAFLIAVIISISFNRRIADRLESRLSSCSHGKTGYLKLAVIIVSTIILMWMLRWRHDLWGGGHVLEKILEGRNSPISGAPLSILVNQLFFILLGSTFLVNASFSCTIVGILAGMAFFATAIKLARTLHSEDSNTSCLWILTAGFIIFNGYTVLFTGTGSNGALAILFCSLFILSAILSTRNELPVYIPSILLAITIFSQFTAIYMLPGFIYIIIKYHLPGKKDLKSIEDNLEMAIPDSPFQGKTSTSSKNLNRTNPNAKERKNEALLSAGAFVIVWFILEFALRFGGFESPTIGLIHIIKNTLRGSVTSTSQTAMHYLNNTLGVLFLIGPSSLAAVVFMISRTIKKRSYRYNTELEEDILVLFAIPAIMILIIGTEGIDSGLRWDAFASTVPALTIYTAWAMKNRLAASGRLHTAAMPLLYASIFHLIPLLVVNLSTPMAEKRLHQLPLYPGRAEMILANRAMEENNTETAQEFLYQATAKDTTNEEAFFYLGNLLVDGENYIDAIQQYNRAIDINPFRIDYRKGLIEAYIGKRWFEEAKVILEDLISKYPDSTHFWNRLGYVRNHSGEYRKAVEAYSRALQLEPDKKQNLKNLTSATLNLGAQLQKDGKLDEARKYYNRAIDLFPESWYPYNNLAVMEMENNNYKDAREILQKGLNKNPGSPELNFNMGMVMEKLGDDQKALEYLRKSARFNPFGSSAPQHIQRLERKLQKNKNNEDATD